MNKKGNNMNIKELLEHIKTLGKPKKENNYVVTLELKDRQIKEEIAELKDMKRILKKYPTYTSVGVEQKAKVKKYYPKNKCWSDINK